MCQSPDAPPPAGCSAGARLSILSLSLSSMGTHRRTLPSAERHPAAAAAAAAAWSHDSLKLLSGVEYKASEVI